MALIWLIILNFYHILSILIQSYCSLEESPGHTYAAFAKNINIHCNPDELDEAFRRNFKNLSKRKLCYGFRKGGEVAWWVELVKNCFADVSKSFQSL